MNKITILICAVTMLTIGCKTASVRTLHSIAFEEEGSPVSSRIFFQSQKSKSMYIFYVTNGRRIKDGEEHIFDEVPAWDTHGLHINTPYTINFYKDGLLVRKQLKWGE